jgi:hypothetical protein
MVKWKAYPSWVNACNVFLVLQTLLRPRCPIHFTDHAVVIVITFVIVVGEPASPSPRRPCSRL